MNPIRFIGLRGKWRKAQKIHAMEHETRQDLSLSCTAVGHLAGIDSYFDVFDRDQQRHFLVEYREGLFA